MQYITGNRAEDVQCLRYVYHHHSMVFIREFTPVSLFWHNTLFFAAFWGSFSHIDKGNILPHRHSGAQIFPSPPVLAFITDSCFSCWFCNARLQQTYMCIGPLPAHSTSLHLCYSFVVCRWERMYWVMFCIYLVILSCVNHIRLCWIWIAQ